MGFDPYNFTFRKNSKTELIMAYVKKPTKSGLKHHNVIFEPPIDHRFLIKSE